MKRMIMTLTAALVMSCAAMAQTGGNGEKKPADKTEMVRKRTEAVAARYGLNEEQKAKLLELNARYADSIRVGMRVQGGRRMPAGDRMKTNDGRRHIGGHQGGVKDSVAIRRMPAGQPRKIDAARRMERAGAMKRYDEKLKGIMTSEQYQKYTEDMNKRMQRQARPRNGMRQ